jgi:probable F420-dependent oxidoreductase
VKVDAALRGPFEEAGTVAAGLEKAGYDGVITFEGPHDPFVPLVLAATQTSRVELCTGIAVAFARNPMNLAHLAYDLQLVSRGRFILGLGSQIKPHIEKRFSMPWSHPAARMRELILAIRAIWASWQEGKPLRFEGEFYRHTLMTPFFNPGPNPYGTARIFLAAVGEQMTEVAAEVADGVILHAFTNERYLREVTLPAVERGLAKSGRRREDFQVTLPCFVVTGDTDAEIDAMSGMVRQQIAFYGSTPAYRAALEVHGWGDLQSELNTLSKQGRWTDMTELVGGQVLDAFAVQGSPDEIPERLLSRYGDIVDRVSFYTFAGGDGAAGWTRIVDGLRRGTAPSAT